MEDLDQLGKLRKEIDAIDSQLLVLLNRRARLAQEIGRIKERNGRPVYAPERAEQLMRRLVSESEGPLDELAIRAIYREIMSASLALEKDTVIAAEGELAGLTHLAAKQQFGSSVRYTFHGDTVWRRGARRGNFGAAFEGKHFPLFTDCPWCRRGRGSSSLSGARHHHKQALWARSDCLAAPSCGSSRGAGQRAGAFSDIRS